MTDPAVVTTREAFVSTARSAPVGARIPVEVTTEVADPFDAYRRARRGTGLGECYLETTGGQSGWGYFGVDPTERLRVGADAVARTGDSPTLEALSARLSAETLVRGTCAIPYPCGAIGWLSYDVVRELETVPEAAVDDRRLPRLQLAVFDRLAAWKEPRTSKGPTTVHITACPRVGDDRAPETAYDSGLERALELVEEIHTGEPTVGPPPVACDRIRFESECGRRRFEARVRRVKERIRDGDTFQVNLSQRLVAPAAVHPVAAFAALRRVNPAPYSALLEFPDVDLVSASPELLLHVDGRRLVTEPIAGTRPRGTTIREDDAMERELRTDGKERAEHAMLVDLERNDLGKVSKYGTVDVVEYRRVDRYAAVMHLVSIVTGRRRSSASLADAIGAVFPGGTITGAPKPRTMAIIDEQEDTRRGPYTGSIGLFGFDDRATLNIVIRTLVRHGDEYHLRVGAGIVHDSIPGREYDETMDKARALIEAVDEALGNRASMEVRAEGA